jgi:FlaA1/EpsC-like NDP-sugar epimerase
VRVKRAVRAPASGAIARRGNRESNDGPHGDATRTRPLPACPGHRRSRAAAEAGYDAAAWLCGLAAAAWVTRDLAGAGTQPYIVVRAALSVIALQAASGLLAGLYRRRYQRGSFDEFIAIAMAASGSALTLAVLGPFLIPGQRAPLATVAASAAFALPAMLGARYVALAGRLRSRTAASSAEKIIIFGAGSAGTQLAQRLAGQSGSEYQPVAMLDDDPAKRRLRIRGIPVLGGRDQMAEAAAATGATVLVIAIARASGPAIRELTVQAESCGLTPKVVPSVKELLSGSARIDGVRDPRLSDLLGRRPVETDVAAVAGSFAGKRILVTGAGGSIGSELCRQLHKFRPAELIMLDHDESALHAVQLSLHGRALLDSDETALADIRDARRIRHVFEQVRPQIVFHAAALKHLPLLERYPAEALKSNVWGTLNVLEAAAACGVESFVNISTDKAADPVSVLGYSKRMAERLTAHMASQADGTYLSVRFGNVLGSRGSVLTALTAQVAAGGPITVTHPDVSRYFMTADEAVQLVLQAAVIGRDGEVLVLDMGEQVQIADIARRLAAGAARQIDIVYTGLRPGEKLTEDLLGLGELDRRPHHPLISHVPVPVLAPFQIMSMDPDVPADELRAAFARCADSALSGLAPSGAIGC